MRLFLYYSFHTTWNQLRKLFTTWMFLIGLAIVLGGGLIGFGAARFYQDAPLSSEVTGTVLPESFMEFFDASGLTANDALELGAGLIILAVLVIQVIGAEKSVSRLFLPADVNFLFASDMTPQQVLTFRLLTTLGTAVAASVYLFFQLPSLVSRFGLTQYAAVSVLLTWCLTIVFGALLKILIYELGSRILFLKENLRWIMIVFLAFLLCGLYYSYQTSEEQVFLLSAVRFFNAPVSRWIPVWGWLKGILMCALEGNTRRSVVFLLLSASLAGILAVLIRVLPVDYYEEALIRSEELALYMETVNSDSAGLLVSRPNHYREGIDREAFRHGEGASVYFFKTMMNRMRFARFGFVTKTMITYFCAAIGGGLFVRMFMDEPSVYPPVFLLAVIVFFRTIGSPISEDIRRDSFSMIPENTWKKLLFSQLGGSLNCAMDALLPLLAGIAAAGMNPLRGFLYLPFIVSVDFFASAVGTFVDVAIPSSIDKTFKQVIQILLLYFGMIPDELIIAFGIIAHHDAAGISLASLVNLFLGTLFFGLAGVWLDPSPGTPVKDSRYRPDEIGAYRAGEQIAVALLMMYLFTAASQLGLIHLVSALPEESAYLNTCALYLPVYVIGFPVFVLLTRHMRMEWGEARTIPLRKGLIILPVSFFLMYSGSFAGVVVSSFFGRILPFHVSLPIPDPGETLPWLETFFLVIMSPLMEEVLFRKYLIDRLRPFGDLPAVVVSALLFGLFHANFRQLFYAALLGLVFGYIYLRTNRLVYSVSLHILINAMGTVIAPYLLSLAMSALPELPLYEIRLIDVIAKPQFLVFFLYLILLIMLSLIGAVFFAKEVKELRLPANHVSWKAFLASPAMILFMIVMLVLCFAAL